MTKSLEPRPFLYPKPFAGSENASSCFLFEQRAPLKFFLESIVTEIYQKWGEVSILGRGKPYFLDWKKGPGLKARCCCERCISGRTFRWRPLSERRVVPIVKNLSHSRASLVLSSFSSSWSTSIRILIGFFIICFLSHWKNTNSPEKRGGR